MANYTEDFKSKLDWAMPFQRTGKFPLDRTDLFSSYEDAVKYAAGNTEDPDSRGLCGTSYIGQIITVFENDVVSVYKIEANRSLSQVGTSYMLPIATADTLGGVKIGAGLEINPATGVLSATGGGTADSVDWSNITSKPDFKTVATTGSYNDLIDKPEIPANTSDLVNDSNFVSDENYIHTDNNYTSADKSKLEGIEAGAQVNVNADWNAAEGDAQILNKPTALSAFTNDRNFIDNTVNNLVNYYTSAKVDELLAAISTLDIQVVAELPSDEISTTTIYLKPKSSGQGQNIYAEYIYVSSTSKWEQIGDTQVDLSTYLQKTGDGSQVTVTFVESGERTPFATGETLSVILGKIAKYLSDLKNVAFTGSYNDLTDKPTVYPHLTIEQLTITAGELSATTLTTFTDSTISSIICRDSVTGEQVLVDWSLTEENKIKVDIASQYSNNLEVNISYLAS